MKDKVKNKWSIVKISALALFLVGCATNAITGRSQLILFPASEDVAMGTNALLEIRKTEPILKSGPYVDRVKRIGYRISPVSDKPDFPWSFDVIDRDVMNAFALPGGKTAVYMKMIKAFPDDNELAAVMGHEIAHAVLRHGAEQVSRGTMTAGLLGALAVGLSSEDEEKNKKAQMIVGLAAMATQVGVALPHSRNMELEADHIGAIYMAKAGYDPRAAVRVWQKMRRLSGQEKAVGFSDKWFSTHPTDEQRISQLEANMAEYLSHYKK